MDPMTQALPRDAPLASRDLLLAMEADLRTPQGVPAACRVFAQSPDPIDPAALAVLVAIGGPAVDQVMARWRALLDADP